jgi:hypothetical protein
MIDTRVLRWQVLVVSAALAAAAAAHATTFSLPDASLRYDVELTTEACGQFGCNGKLTVTLFKKGTKTPVQSFTEADCGVELDEKGRPLANVTKLYDVASAVMFDDLDFDGEEDVAIKRTAAGYVGFAYTVFLFDPNRRRLVRSRSFSKAVDAGVLDFFQVDRPRQRLFTLAKDGCCVHYTYEHAVENGTLRLAKTTTDDNGKVTVDEHRLGDGVKKPGPPEALRLVEQWLAAQNQGRFDDYQALYAKTFAGVRRSGARSTELDREGWLADRRGMFARPMTVRLAFAVASYAGDRVEVRGTQTYASGSYRDRGLKVFQLMREDGQWKIGREELLSSEIVPTRKP